MYTPSPEAEAIRHRLGGVINPGPGLKAAADVPCIQIRTGCHSISLQIGDPALRNSIEQRFEVSSPSRPGVSLELTLTDYPTQYSDLLLVSPFRTVMAKRKGMVYFGVRDVETLSVLAGSLGAVAGEAGSATETDFIQCLIETEIITALARIAPELDFAHAASVSRNSQAIVLAGPSGSGKTTLSVAASLRGFELLGDDVACLDLERRTAYAYPRKPRLRAGTLERLDFDGAEFNGRIEAEHQSQIAAICVLNGFAAKPSLTKLEGMDAVWRVSRHIFHAGRPVAPNIARLAGQIPSIPCYQLIAGSPNETLSILSSTIGIN